VASHEWWDVGWAAARFCRVAAHFPYWLVVEPNGGQRQELIAIKNQTVRGRVIWLLKHGLTET